MPFTITTSVGVGVGDELLVEVEEGVEVGVDVEVVDVVALLDVLEELLLVLAVLVDELEEVEVVDVVLGFTVGVGVLVGDALTLALPVAVGEGD
jgi:hypothetical protein